MAVLDLKAKRNNNNNNQRFFNHKNHLFLQHLIDIITQIKKFITEISQLKTLLEYVQVKSVEKTFKDLCKRFIPIEEKY